MKESRLHIYKYVHFYHIIVFFSRYLLLFDNTLKKSSKQKTRKEKTMVIAVCHKKTLGKTKLGQNPSVENQKGTSLRS